jgi:hypothetical protein
MKMCLTPGGSSLMPEGVLIGAENRAFPMKVKLGN